MTKNNIKIEVVNITVNMTIGMVDSYKLDIDELSDDDIENGMIDQYRLIVKKCLKSDCDIDYDIYEYSLNESSFNISNQGFGFFWERIAYEISGIIKMYDHSAIMTPDKFKKFGMEKVFSVPFFCLFDPFMTSLKPILTEIEKLPDIIDYKELTSDDNAFFGDVIKWLKYWSVKAVELYDEDAYIEFA